MIVAVHQPQYLPWLGYFDKIDRADLFVTLETVQYKKNEFQNRNRIKTAQGWQWLTVPVRYRFPQRIDEVTVNDNVNWRHKHRQALRYATSVAHTATEPLLRIPSPHLSPIPRGAGVRGRRRAPSVPPSPGFGGVPSARRTSRRKVSY